MAISLSDNLALSGSKNNFERDSYATLELMKAVKATKMPNVMTAVCEETGKLYIYNKAAEVDEVLGKWREVGAAGAGAGAAQRYVLLTQAEYDALTEKEEDVLYLIKEE
jgi:hypothetical protein